MEHIRYKKETEVVTFQGKEITLENLSPVFTPEQEAAKRRELEQQLRRESTGRTETPAGSWAAWWETAGLEQRRQAAALLLREVRLYPDHGEAGLH